MKINPGVVKNIVQKYPKPFCEQYWENWVKNGLLRQSKKDCVSLHGHLNGINHPIFVPNILLMKIQFILIVMTFCIG